MSELLSTGFELMLLGMGMVFVFLSLLVIMLRGMSAFALKVGGPSVLTLTPPQLIAKPQTTAPTVAVISAAVAHYRATRCT